MTTISAAKLITPLTLLLCICSVAQETNRPAFAAHRNVINAYVGLFELNLNYERNISQRPKSFTSLRLGMGKGMFLTAGEGYYINPAAVNVFGSGNSHLEIDLGGKIMVTNSMENPGFFQTVVPDLFIGYRYEKPAGNFVFRAGNNYPTLFNIGIGCKF
jgi:hypothetical protein